MTAAASAELDDAKREEMLHDTVKVAMDDAAVPAGEQLGLDYTAWMDERSTAMATRAAS